MEPTDIMIKEATHEETKRKKAKKGASYSR
jgi:hypothetical protein